jgi:hypothetical protein
MSVEAAETAELLVSELVTNAVRFVGNPGSGVGGDGWYPGVPGERVADGGERLVPMLGGGGCVAAGPWRC